MGDKVTVHIDAALVDKMRAKAIAGGLPNARSIPDEELLAALITAEIGKAAPITGAPVELRPELSKVWVDFNGGLNLRVQPATGEIIRILTDEEELTTLDRQDDWLQVRTIEGLTGWVLAKHVSDVDPYSSMPPKGNVRGIHGAAGATAPPRHLWDAWISELKAMGMAWYKQLDAGDPNDIGGNSTFDWALELKRSGIEPIIRYVQGQMFPDRLHDMAFEKMKRYATEGIVWCEVGNEPNVDRDEWHSDHHGKLSWQNPFYPRTIVENWIEDAERAVAAGVRPGFYAFAPTDWGPARPHAQLSSVMFYQHMFEYVAADSDLQRRFQRLFEPGKAWLAVHAATFGLSFDFDPFPANESPYDMCLRGYEIPLRYIRELLPADTHLTVMSTEGGVFTKGSASIAGHRRLHSHVQHAQRTVGMFHWIQKSSPLQAMCPWLISNVYEAIGHTDQNWAQDGWYDGGPPDFGPKPVVQAMKNSKPAF